ncbi:hypothetical protein ACN28S_04475 [Cystobacter fuscus]
MTLLHLVFAMPVPELQLSPREWHWVRIVGVLVVLLNYAWVVVVTRFPHLLA